MSIKLISNRHLEIPAYIHIIILIPVILCTNEDCKGQFKRVSTIRRTNNDFA